MKARVLASALLIASSSYAQSTGPAAQAPVFRSGVDLVRVDVRVTDDEGRPIADLRPDEVQIKEEGALRPVLLFQHVQAPQGTYAEAAQRTIAAQVSTNQGSPRGHVYVFVFDESHLQPGREQRARRAAERFLRTRARPGDRVALYALPGPGPQVPFTSDVAHVLKALSLVRGSAEASGNLATGGTRTTMRMEDAYEIVRGNAQVLDRVASQASQTRVEGTDTRSTASNRSNDVDEDRGSTERAVTEDARALVGRADGDARRFLMALADLVRTLRQVDGRKTVLLFSEGFQIDNVTHELEDVAAAAAQSYSAIYAMDLNVRGVEAGDDTPRGGEQITGIRDKLQSLGSLAAETAGELVTDAEGQLDRVLGRVAASTEDYYLVGFAPVSAAQGPSRYRRIQVTVSRSGARVSARTGYAPNQAATPADRRRAISAALAAPFAHQGLRVEYTTYAMRGSAADTQWVILSLAAELPIASISTKEADIIYVVRNVETGKVAASGTDVMRLPDAPAAPGATVGTGVYHVRFEVPAGVYLMRALVREPGGLLGSADRRFQVRALNGPEVTASDLVIGSGEAAGLPVRATAYQSEALDGVFELYGRTAAQLDAITVTADLVPVGGGPTAVSTRADLQPVKPAAGGLSRGARIDLPLDGVASGEYLARAIIRDQGGTIAELLRDVTVRAGTRPAAAAAPDTGASFNPLSLLGGDLARSLVESILARVTDAALERASRAAATGTWSAVDAALGSSSSGSADASVLRGLAAFARGDYHTAIAALGAAQDAGSADPALWFVMGWANSAAGDDPVAITAWRNAIVGDPRLVPAYLALMDSYERLGHPELAVQVAKTGLRELPRSPELLDRLARLEGR